MKKGISWFITHTFAENKKKNKRISFGDLNFTKDCKNNRTNTIMNLDLYTWVVIISIIKIFKMKRNK